MIENIKIVAAVISLLVAGMQGFVLQAARNKISDPVRFALWRVWTLFLMLSSIKMGLGVFGLVPELVDIVLWALMASGVTVYLIWYLLTRYVNNKYLDSSGVEIEDNSFFNIIPFVVDLIIKGVLQLGAMEIRLIYFENNEVKMTVEVKVDLRYPYQFHFGIEWLKVLVGRLHTRGRWLEVGESIQIAEVQAHNLIAAKGTIFESVIRFSDDQAQMIMDAVERERKLSNEL